MLKASGGQIETDSNRYPQEGLEHRASPERLSRIYNKFPLDFIYGYVLNIHNVSSSYGLGAHLLIFVAHQALKEIPCFSLSERSVATSSYRERERFCMRLSEVLFGVVGSELDYTFPFGC